MRKNTIASACIAVVLGWFALSPPVALAQGAVASADAQALRIVNGANQFLATLTPQQKSAVVFAFGDDQQRKNWSNFPQGGAGVMRKGLAWGDLSDSQRSALVNLLGAVLSPEGVQMVREQMDADDIIKATDTGQPPDAPPAGPAGGQRPAVSFGSAFYFMSFVGAPSATAPWMLQFGGHHLAINATIVGPNITLSPTLSGGEPLKYSKDGKSIYIVEKEATLASALLASLTAVQKAKAIISSRLTDLVLGPGQDGKVLQPEGLPASAMTAAQKAQFLALIRARLGMLNADDLVVAMAPVEANLEQTYFAWYGPTNTGAGYFRVTGPTVLIEFSPQTNDGDATNHAHNMYRDPTNEYGSAWMSGR